MQVGSWPQDLGKGPWVLGGLPLDPEKGRGGSRAEPWAGLTGALLSVTVARVTPWQLRYSRTGKVVAVCFSSVP